MVWTSLVRGRYKESLQVGEKDVAAAVQEEGGDEQKADTQSFEYKMQPIVLIVPRGSAPDAVETRKKEAEALRARDADLRGGQRFLQVDAKRRDTRYRDQDLGRHPALRFAKCSTSTPIGHLTPPEVTKQGVEMVALCARNPTTVDTPKKKEIRDKMYAEKYEAKSKSYLQEVRKAAMIECRSGVAMIEYR